MRIFSKKDFFMVVILASLATAAWILTGINKANFSHTILVIIDGNTTMEINKAGEYPIYRNGKRITTLIFDGKRARVVNSTCPLKICEKIGWISPGGEIICVPNHLVIRFKERGEADAITW